MNTRSRIMASARSISATNIFGHKTIWIWPIVATGLLAIIGWSIRTVVERSVGRMMAKNLETILDADVAALEIWIQAQRVNAQAAAVNERIREHVVRLVEESTGADVSTATLLNSASFKSLRTELTPWLQSHGYNGYLITNRQGFTLASARDELVGKPYAPFLVGGIIDKVFAGNTTVTLPFKSIALLESESGELQAGVPTMFAVAPVAGPGGEVVAAFALRIRPDVDFTRILSIGRSGETGETYAFDRNGLLLSGSRFDDDLKRIGLLPDQDGMHSILNIELRDPQVDMTLGHRPSLRRSEQPLTHLVREAVAGRRGVDVDGYRDYRGVPVIGAWMWLPEYEFGVGTETDVAEAYRPVVLLRYAFWGLFGLSALAAVAIFMFSVVVARVNRAAQKAVIVAKQLGQYTLDEKIGAGGMGTVFRGHHAMLRRPTAIKLLDPEKTTPDAVARFEREVRLTSQLNHPNTIAIYDYGRTPEGVFYYAMELLDGIDLEKLVDRHGPQPAGRVIHILRQVCGSLAEAHSIGLIHRDIKPANIILSRRGGLFDFVKVLDFGLVKAVDASRQSQLTAANVMTGTPAYMSPESVQFPDKVDARSDLYAVGAVGYFLLTGAPMFTGDTVIEICMHQVRTPPVRPSERLNRSLDSELESLLMRALAKDPAVRPQTAAEFLDGLKACRAAADWTTAEAQSWWSAAAATPQGDSQTPSPSTQSSSPSPALTVAFQPES